MELDFRSRKHPLINPHVFGEEHLRIAYICGKPSGDINHKQSSTQVIEREQIDLNITFYAPLRGDLKMADYKIKLFLIFYNNKPFI